MENEYELLRQYRIALDETWEAFASRFAAYSVPKLSLFRALTGRVRPHERTAARIGRYFREHEREIRERIAADAVSTGSAGAVRTMVHGTMPPGATVRTLTGLAGGKTNGD